MSVSTAKKVIRKVTNKTKSIAKKVLYRIFGGVSLFFGLLGAISLIGAISLGSWPSSVFTVLAILCLSIFGLFGFFHLRIKKSYFRTTEDIPENDMEIAKIFLKKIKSYLLKNKAMTQFESIYDGLETRYKYSKEIYVKIKSIKKMTKNSDWNYRLVKEELEETKMNNADETALITSLQNQLENITKINNRYDDLRNVLKDVRYSFNDIYTKLTLLYTKNIASFDETETEVQKILDHQLAVDKFEKQLDRELAEFK